MALRPFERLKPIGFWSYARQDDAMSYGRLSRLRYQLAAELQLIYGKDTIRIFQDVAAIPPGTEWEKAIDDAIDQATFFIPILTPAFVESEWCCREVSKFLLREAEINAAYPELRGQRRIFPIRYIDSRNAEPFDPDVFVALGKVQETNFLDLRHASDDSPLVRDRLATLADALAGLLHVKVRPPLTAEERAGELRRQEDTAAEAKRQAERDRLRQEAAEAERIAEEQRARAMAEAEAARAFEEDRARQEAAEAERIESEERRRDEEERQRALAAERAAARDRWLSPMRQWRVAIAASAAVALAAALVLVSRPTPPSGTSAANEIQSGPVGNAAPEVEKSSTAAPPVAVAAPSTGSPDVPAWIEGNWEVTGSGEGCVIRITLTKAASSLLFARTDTDKSIDMAFKYDEAEPRLLSTSSNRYTLLGSGDIEVTPLPDGNAMRLHKCAP